MAKLVFKLKDVSLDEAEDIRELLAENDILFYETHAGNWGIAMAGIWIRDDARYNETMLLLHEYDKKRAAQFNQDYADLKQAGHAPTLLGNLLSSPLRFFVYIFSIIVVLYISVIPFIDQ